MARASSPSWTLSCPTGASAARSFARTWAVLASACRRRRNGAPLLKSVLILMDKRRTCRRLFGTLGVLWPLARDASASPQVKDAFEDMISRMRDFSSTLAISLFVHGLAGLCGHKRAIWSTVDCVKACRFWKDLQAEEEVKGTCKGRIAGLRTETHKRRKQKSCGAIKAPQLFSCYFRPCPVCRRLLSPTGLARDPSRRSSPPLSPGLRPALSPTGLARNPARRSSPPHRPRPRPRPSSVLRSAAPDAR